MFDIAKLDINSPAYIFLEEEFSERAKKVKAAVGDKIDICFSIKSNAFLLSVLPDAFSKVEVCSPGELEVCILNKIDPDKIIFSGVNKSQAEIQRAIDYGVTIITAESLNHWNYIKACDKPNVIKVLLRLSDESQFGIDEELLVSIVKEYMEEPCEKISIYGIHYFTGTAKKKSKEIAKELTRLEGLSKRLKDEADYDLKEVEYGPGLASDYFASSDQEAEEWEMNLLSEVAEILKSFDTAHLTIEMGRFFAASSGYYITEIVDTKTNDGVNYMIVDGGLHQLKYHGQLQGMQKPVITHLKTEKASPSAIEPWTICGSLCTTADVIARNVELDSPVPGDRLVFHRIGAYSVTEGMALFLTRDLPSVYILKENGNLITARKRLDSHVLY